MSITFYFLSCNKKEIIDDKLVHKHGQQDVSVKWYNWISHNTLHKLVKYNKYVFSLITIMTKMNPKYF